MCALFFCARDFHVRDGHAGRHADRHAGWSAAGSEGPQGRRRRRVRPPDHAAASAASASSATTQAKPTNQTSERSVDAFAR